MSNKNWNNDLTPEQNYILRQEGTESPGSSSLNNEKSNENNNEQNNTIEWTGIDSTQDISLSMEKLRARFFHLMGELFSGEGDILSKTKWKNKSTRMLHDTAWRVFHLLSVQVAIHEKTSPKKTNNSTTSTMCRCTIETK